jgi:hypothetical protein
MAANFEFGSQETLEYRLAGQVISFDETWAIIAGRSCPPK